MSVLYRIRSYGAQALLVILLSSLAWGQGIKYIPGDVTRDWQVTLSDIIFLVNYIFKSTPVPYVYESGDANASCKITLADVIVLVNYIFKSGPEPTGVANNWVPSLNLGAPVNSEYNERTPAIGYDKKTLVFASDRPGGYGGYDLYVSKRDSVNGPWSIPLILSSDINTPEDELYPSLSSDGRFLYFASFNRTGGKGGWDIWLSQWDSMCACWGIPVNMGDSINTSQDETSPFISLDSSMLFFHSSGWGKPQGALYYSDYNGLHFQSPIELDSNLNKTGAEDRPTMIPHGIKYAFDLEMYVSRGISATQIYVYAWTPCGWKYPIRLEPANCVDTFSVRDPYVMTRYCYGEMYFTSTRPGGIGQEDVWVNRPDQNQWCCGACFGIFSAIIDAEGTWSPDSSTISFSSSGGIYLVDSDGSNRRLFVPGNIPNSPAYSADGSWLAFSLNKQIYKIKSDGDSLTQLTFVNENYEPDWSPDGTMLTYVLRIPTSNDPRGIWIMNQDGTNKSYIDLGDYPDWTPDGQKLLHICYPPSTWIEICGLQLSDSSVNQLTFLNGVTWSPKMSPDGTKVVFVYQSPVSGLPQIWSMNSDGDNLKRLAVGGGFDPEWSPDSQRIIYTDIRPPFGRLFIMNADGTGKKQLTKCSQ